MVSIDDAVRKQLQMHMFARNYTKLLKAPKEYGQHFKLGKAYHTTTTKGGKLFIEGRFDKYVDNNDTISSIRRGDEQQQDLQSKAEALCHFSYCRSLKFSMVLVIQGCGFLLTDPKVATIERTNNSEKTLFCGDYLNLKAITAFMYQHKCNDYCRLLKLSDINNNSLLEISRLQPCKRCIPVSGPVESQGGPSCTPHLWGRRVLSLGATSAA